MVLGRVSRQTVRNGSAVRRFGSRSNQCSRNSGRARTDVWLLQDLTHKLLIVKLFLLRLPGWDPWRPTSHLQSGRALGLPTDTSTVPCARARQRCPAADGHCPNQNARALASLLQKAGGFGGTSHSASTKTTPPPIPGRCSGVPKAICVPPLIWNLQRVWAAPPRLCLKVGSTVWRRLRQRDAVSIACSRF